MNLESLQVYGGNRYKNPPDHPAERSEEPSIYETLGQIRGHIESFNQNIVPADGRGY